MHCVWRTMVGACAAQEIFEIEFSSASKIQIKNFRKRRERTTQEGSLPGWTDGELHRKRFASRRSRLAVRAASCPCDSSSVPWDAD